MNTERGNASHSNDASVIRGGGISEQAEVHGTYTAECYGPDGKLKWSDTINNVVTTEGKNNLLDCYFGTVAKSTYYMGLISSVSYTATAAGDTAAQINGTNGWKEANSSTFTPTYSGGVRLAPTFAAASSGSKATSAAVAFSITGVGTVKGCFLANSSTLGGTTAPLYSAGTFTGGDKAVGNGDTLNVSWTGSI